MGLLDRVMLKKARFENEELPPELLPPKEAEEPEGGDGASGEEVVVPVVPCILPSTACRPFS